MLRPRRVRTSSGKKSVSHYRTTKIPGKEGKTLRKEKQGIPKRNKERMDRVANSSEMICVLGFFSLPIKGVGLFCLRLGLVAILRYYPSRDALREVSSPQTGAIPPPWYLVPRRHICAIPHFATYPAIITRYP